MTFNTGNPVGSADPRDLYDNAQNLDSLVNGTLPAYADRLGVSRKSYKGMELEFAAFLAASGFELPPLEYVDGTPLVVDRPTQLIFRTGFPDTLYGVKSTEPFPATLIGTWATDESRLVVRSDGDLRQDLANSTDPANGAGLVGHRGRTVGEKLDDLVSVKDFGAVGDGIADDTAAIQSALSSGAGTVYVPSGTYKVSSTLSVTGNTTVVGAGSGVTTITAQGSTGTFTSAVLLKSGTPPVALPTLASNVSALSNTLVFSAPHGLSVNSIGMIYNPTDFSFSNFREVYRAGEYFTVSEVVDATTVKLTAPVYSPYLAADVLVYSCDGYAKGSVSGLSIIAPGAGVNGVISALRLFNCTSFSVRDVNAIGSDNSTISISQCYKGRVFDVTANQFGQNPGAGTQYGLVYGNTQELDISGTFYGHRHAIAGGGGATFAVPSRAVVAHDFFAANYAPATPAINWHGNCEYCEYRDGVVYGAGVTLAGNKNKASGLTITTSVGFLATAGELLGCDFTLDNIRCTTGINDIARGIINIGGNEAPFTADTKFGGTFRFTNIKITAPNQTRSAVLLRNRGFTAEPFNIIVDNLETQMPASTFAVISINTVSGNAPTYVQATNIQSLTPSATRPLSLVGPSDAGCLVRQSGLSGKVTVNTTTSVNNVSSAVTFPWQFAKTPAINTTSSSRTTGSDRIGAYSVSPTSTGFSAALSRVDDNTNFSAEVPVTVNWFAELSEF